MASTRRRRSSSGCPTTECRTASTRPRPRRRCCPCRRCPSNTRGRRMRMAAGRATTPAVATVMLMASATATQMAATLAMAMTLATGPRLASARSLAMETPLALTAREIHSTRSMMTGCTVRCQPSNHFRSIGTLPLRSLGNILKQNQQKQRRVPRPRLRRTHTGSRCSTVRRPPQCMCRHQQHTQQRRRNRPHSRKSRTGCTDLAQSQTRTSHRKGPPPCLSSPRWS